MRSPPAAFVTETEMTTPNPPADTGTAEPQVLFCNICNQSVPDAAIQQGRAVRMPDGAAPIVGPTSTARAVGGTGPLLTAGVLLVAAIAGLGLFLDWRLDQGARGAQQGLASVDGRVEAIAQRMVTLEQRLANTVAASDLRPVIDLLDTVEKAVPAEGASAREAIAEVLRQLDPLRDGLVELEQATVKDRAAAALLRDELRRIGEAVASLRSAATAAPPVASVPREEAGGAAPPAADPGLPAELQRQVARLGDEAGGVRFEAVDALLRSNDARVFEHLLPLSNDADPFVRRLVFEGLAGHRTKASVEVLLKALEDPDSFVRHTAYASLRQVSGEDIPFDPDARPSDRAAQQRRWRKWWDEAEATF